MHPDGCIPQLDFVVGLDTEFSELMDGSHLYTPQVNIEEVVLAEAKKTLVLDTVKHFDIFTQASRNLELHKRLAYGRGMVLLFYGPSGTGKTMMANALAALIGKKVLMINFPALGANSAGAILKLVRGYGLRSCARWAMTARPLHRSPACRNLRGRLSDGSASRYRSALPHQSASPHCVVTSLHAAAGLPRGEDPRRDPLLRRVRVDLHGPHQGQFAGQHSAHRARAS